jgi:hypothetical protein
MARAALTRKEHEVSKPVPTTAVALLVLSSIAFGLGLSAYTRVSRAPSRAKQLRHLN